MDTAALTDPLADTAAGPSLQIPGVSLEAPLGRGAFGSVFRGQHRVLDVPVAVKVVDPAVAPGQALDMALREARLMARLDHPNLVRILDAGKLGGGFYLVLELMDGGSFERLRRMGEPELLATARQALSGLQALHDARIIHRDIKPANLLRRTADGRVKLGDLGIALLQATRVGDQRSAGTLPFMAPELWGEPPRYSPASDLYALGLSLCCLALDSDPFPTESVSSLMAWVLGKARPDLSAQRPDLSPSLCSLVGRLIDPSCERRPQSAAEALADLDATPRTPSSPSPSLRTVGPWRIESLVWASANWESHTAHHRVTGAPARWAHARPGGATAGAAATIARGGALATTLQHPGFLPVLDWGELEGRPWVVTAPQGQDLISLMASRQPIDEPTALEFGATLAEALSYLHGRGLVYQAVAPGSVFIRQDARSVQLGWPWFIVKAGTRVANDDGTSARAGIPHYMAPEAFSSSGAINPAEDLWGLGEVLFLLLAGRSPFEPASSSLMAIVAAKVSPRPRLREVCPDVTAPTERVVEALLDRDPAARPDAASVAGELRRIKALLQGAR